TDIKTILYTEKSLNLQEQGVVVIQTSPKMTKTGLKAVLKEYFVKIKAHCVLCLKRLLHFQPQKLNLEQEKLKK
ncbi:hypothetical protein VWM68_10260, partial [Campylobacter coli]